MIPIPELDQETRRGGIGSSEVATLTKFRKYGTPLKLYAIKTGRIKEDVATFNMKKGTILEPLMAEMYTLDTGIPLVGDGRTTMIHSEHDWIRATPDRIAEDRSHAVEFKFVGMHNASQWGYPGTDQVPPHINLQAQQQMFVAGVPMCVVCAIFGESERLEKYPIQANDSIFDSIVKITKGFWFDHVVPDIPPAPVWESPEEPALVMRMSNARPGLSMDFNEVQAQMVYQYRSMGDEYHAIEKKREELRGRIVAMMGECSRGRLPTGEEAVISEVKGFKVPERFQEPYRKLTISKGKKR